MERHFYTCPVQACQIHPIQHGDGCDPGVKHNLEKGKCRSVFCVAHSDVDDVRNFSIKGFVKIYLQHQNGPS